MPVYREKIFDSHTVSNYHLHTHTQIKFCSVPGPAFIAKR